MNAEKLSWAISEIGDKYYEEAACYERGRGFPVWLKWRYIAACVAVAAVCYIGMQQYRYRNDTITLDSGEAITFVNSDNRSSGLLMYDYETVDRDLTEEELGRMFPDLSAVVLAHPATFATSGGQFVHLEGEIGDAKFVIWRADESGMDTSIGGIEETSEVGDVPVTAGYFITEANSRGKKTAIYYATIELGNHMIYVEKSGPKEERETTKKELADIIKTLIDNGELDVPRF